MLKLTNRTNQVVPIESYELAEYETKILDIPYENNLKLMERVGIISVVEVQSPVEEVIQKVEEEQVLVEDIQQEEVVVEEKQQTPIKRGRKPKNVSQE